jgi:L-seryl-tRNA(Ser) seleniumtransferase
VEKELKTQISESLRLLPSVDSLLHSKTAVNLTKKSGTNYLLGLARKSIDILRLELKSKITIEDISRDDLHLRAENILENLWNSEQTKCLQRVINASGVVIHTNLGRSPLSENAKKAIIETAGNYCNLEYNLETGKRGKRGERSENLLAELCCAEAALIVNNCAAACVLVLTALSNGGEAVISRGEMVEIGGDFRVPDVMIQSGAILREVGSTNRTKIRDYEKAINENTRLILKVHPSNYRIIGFTEIPTISELAEVSKLNNIFLYEDAGSGALVDLSKYGLIDEPIISQSIANGADVVSFSGDKLLGGVQSGLIVGRAEIIEKLRKHPLYRALRVDKIIYSALGATLESFRKETHLEEIPTLRMISTTNSEIAERASQFVVKLKNFENLTTEICSGNSVIGGGSAPAVHPETTLILLKHKKLSVNLFEKRLRSSKTPIIARILEESVSIDLRTVSAEEEIELLQILRNI